MPRLIRLLLLFAFAAAPGLFASVCVVDTLANYEALSSGCQIGPFTVKSFAYSQISGTNTIADTSITVTPTTGPSFWELTFSSSSFNLPVMNTTAKYLLTYYWDPGDIRSLEDILNANSPVFPGFAQVSTAACENDPFTGTTCPNAIDTIMVNDNGHVANLTAGFTFPSGLSTVGIQNTIELDANTGSSEFTSFSNIIASPEPATLTGGLLALGLAFRRLRLKRP